MRKAVWVACLLSAVSSFAAGQIVDMKLLTADAGWASTNDQLFWTTDGGAQWKDITPQTKNKRSIDSVFFLDTSTGWVLLVSDVNAVVNGVDEPSLDLAATNDAGQHWTITPVRVPHLDPKATTLDGGGDIDFVDSLHGWMNLSLESSSNFRLGIILATKNGGKTWDSIPQGPGVYGSIHFVSRSDGWVAGGPGDQHLYATHDGGESWQEVSLKTPTESRGATVPLFSLPDFSDETHGLLHVTYFGADGSGIWLVLFTTDDGGRTWRPSKSVTKLPSRYGNVPLPAAAVDSVLIMPGISNNQPSGNGHELVLSRVSPNGNTHSNGSKPNNVEIYHVSKLSFADENRGWILTDVKLLATRNAGKTWLDITPMPHKREAMLAPLTGSVDVSASSNPLQSQTAGTSTYTGFHTCEIPVAHPDMLTLWNSSPFFDVGPYIGGISRSCANKNLTSTWVSNVQGMGWGLIPLWVGPQAPCTSFKHVFGSTPTQAQQDGTNEANSAITAAQALGIASVIYYDLENYNSSNSSCAAAVNAFLSGWKSQLNSNGYVDGVYGSPADAEYNWTVAPNPPSNVWIAKTLKTGDISAPRLRCGDCRR